MEIERGGKRKEPSSGGSPLSIQPRSRPALETAEKWTTLSPQIGAELFGQMDVATFVRYCNISKAIRRWCDTVRSLYPLVFVRALESMLVNSDIHSVLAVCSKRDSDIWQYAGYENEAWVANARRSNPHGYPQVRDDVWKTLFDTSILPCIPPYYETTANGPIQPRPHAKVVWNVLRDAANLNEDHWEGLVAEFEQANGPYDLDEYMIGEMVRLASEEYRMKYLVLNTLPLCGLFTGLLHYRDDAYLPIRDIQTPANQPPSWTLVGDLRSNRVYAPGKRHAELHPNLDATPDLLTTTVVVDWGNRTTKYAHSVVTLGLDSEHPQIVCTLNDRDSVQALVTFMMMEEHGEGMLQGADFVAASLETIHKITHDPEIKRHGSPRAAEESMPVFDQSFATMDNQGVFAYLERVLGRRKEPRDIHWSTAYKYTMEALPRSVRVKRKFATYDYPSGTYGPSATSTLFSRDLQHTQKVADVMIDMQNFMFESKITGPSEVVHYDLGDGNVAYYLFFTYPDATQYHWMSSDPNDASALAALVLLRVVSFVITTATETISREHTRYIPMRLLLSADIPRYSHVGYNLSGLLYDAEARRLYRETHLAYAPFISLLSESEDALGIDIFSIETQTLAVPIERFFLLPDTGLLHIERALMGNSTRFPFDANWGSGARFRALEPQAAVRFYLGLMVQHMFDYNALFNQPATIDYYVQKSEHQLSAFAVGSLISTIDRLSRLFDLLIGDPTGLESDPLWTELRQEYTADPKRPRAAIWGLHEWYAPIQRRPLEQNDAFIARQERIFFIRADIHARIKSLWQFAFLFVVFQQYLLGTPRFLRGMVLFVSIAAEIYGDYYPENRESPDRIGQKLAQLEMDVIRGVAQPLPSSRPLSFVDVDDEQGMDTSPPASARALW